MVTTVRGTDNLFLILWKYLTFSQFFLFHVISEQLLCHLRRPFCVLWVLVFNYFFYVLLGQRSKPGSQCFCFFPDLTASTKRANLTWLPLEIMHRGHTWHDYPWPWASLTRLLYNLQLWRLRNWFRKFTVRFRPIRKEIVSWMYNKMYSLRPKQVSRLVTLGYLCLTPKGARQAARRRLQTNSTTPTGRLEMNSWGNNNNNELYLSLMSYSSGTVPY